MVVFPFQTQRCQSGEPMVRATHLGRRVVWQVDSRQWPRWPRSIPRHGMIGIGGRLQPERLETTQWYKWIWDPGKKAVMLSDVKLNAQTVRVWGCMKQNWLMSAFSMVDLKAYQPILTTYIHLALIWISQICGHMIATTTEATTTPLNGPAIMERKLCEYRNEASRQSMTDIATTQMHLHKTMYNVQNGDKKHWSVTGTEQAILPQWVLEWSHGSTAPEMQTEVQTLKRQRLEYWASNFSACSIVQGDLNIPTFFHSVFGKYIFKTNKFETSR